MPVTQRFRSLMDLTEPEVALDEAALLIAAHAYPDLDVAAELTRLDEVAGLCVAPTLDALVRLLFSDLGFIGNTEAYFDPRNSYLNDVMARRMGIPISLGVLTMVVGRRIGVPLVGVGMPGHFLLRDQVDPTVFVDPFVRGAFLDVVGCSRAFHAVHGTEASFDQSFLAPVGTFAIIGRMLANLRSVFAARGDRANLTWVIRLRTMVPGVAVEERGELATVLAASGRFAEAATEYEQLADLLGGDLGGRYRDDAHALRARLN